MTKFKTREEYEHWKATHNSGVSPLAKSTGTAVDSSGRSVAKRKPRLWLLIVGAIVIAGSSAFLFATGDLFSGTFVLVLGFLIVGFYAYFKMRPHLDDADYLKTAGSALVKTALQHGRVSQQDVEALKQAEEQARERYAREQAGKK
jgi:hypothetical protein